MSLQRRAGTLALVLLVLLGGCLGSGVAPGGQATERSSTSAPTPERTSVDPSPGTPTMGEIPTASDRTAETLDRIRELQDGIESYRATVTETRVTQLSNGSELVHERTRRVWVKYTDEGVLTRVESRSADSPNETDIYVRNRTASITYDPGQDEYRIDRTGGATDRKETGTLHPHLRSDGGEYNLFEAPTEVIKKENAVYSNGTQTVRGREAYVVHLDGNPNGGTLAYYDAQTLWVDAETGLVLRQTAQKPHLESMRNVTVSELRNPEENDPFNESDDGPNAVYLGDKTITTTYTNVSVNDVDADVFNPDIPADADVEDVTRDDE